MLNISVDILTFGHFLDLLITFQCERLLAVEEFSNWVGMSISCTFWKNTNQGNYILPSNNTMCCLCNIMWLEYFICTS